MAIPVTRKESLDYCLKNNFPVIPVRRNKKPAFWGYKKDGKTRKSFAYEEDLFKNLEEIKTFEISKNSLIKEKIKEIELKKRLIDLNIDDETYYDNVNPHVKNEYIKYSNYEISINQSTNVSKSVDHLKI